MLSVVIPAALAVSAILLGWGFDAWREYFVNPARLGVLILIAVASVLAMILRLDLDVLKRGRLPVANQSFTLGALAVASLALIWFLPFADRRHILSIYRSAAFRDAGLLLCTVGMVVRILAMARLGKQFSAYATLQENHELVRSGIYAYVRHPLYLSLLLAAPGFALVFGSALVWPILAVTATFVTIRIRNEDALLKQEFGETFEQYRNSVGALIPRLIRQASTRGI